MQFTSVAKPEYFYQPLQLFRRLRAEFVPCNTPVRLRLPGGAEFVAPGADHIAQAILHLGVFDLVVTEALWRLIEPGDVAVDAGANIGYMSSIMAARAAQVWAFEPHPQLFRELQVNCDLARAKHTRVKLESRQVGLSQRTCKLFLEPFDPASGNRGTSTVIDRAATNAVEVCACRLDDVLDGVGQVGLMKVDVEGHERPLLEGAAQLLARRAIRDIVFEEHRDYPSDVTILLESSGYHVFRLHRRFRGPALLEPQSSVRRVQWEATSFLATLDPQRAQARFAPRGWQCLRGGR